MTIHKMHSAFRLTALAAALLTVYGPAHAAEGFVLEPNSVSIGVGGWSNDRPQQGRYDGMRDSGSNLLLDADLSKRDDATGTWLGLKARNLGLDNRELELEWLRQGDIGASLEYSRIPYDNPYIYNTGVQGIGTSTLRVPTPSIVPGTGANAELGTVRDRLTAKFYKNLGIGLNFNASFRHEDKEGTRAWSRGGASEFAVEPIGSTTQQLEAILSYAKDRLQLSGGYYGTLYDNSNKTVVTSLTSLAAATTYNLSLPLSSTSHEVFLNGGYDFTPTTRGTFKGSYSTVLQDEAIPSSNDTTLVWPAGQAPSPLAPKSLNGRLDTSLLEAGLTAKPMPKLSVLANLRYRDFKDKTPVQGLVFAGVTPTVFNTPFSYTNKTGKLEATYRLPESYSAVGGIEYKGQDRSVPNVGMTWVPFRQTLNEMNYRAELRKSMSETLNGSLAYVYGNRDGSAYKVPGDAANPLQDLINPLNIANRKREKFRALVDWAPIDKLGFQFTVEEGKDKYGGPGQYGLQDGSASLYSVDANYALNTDWQVRAWYTRDQTKAHEITQQTATNLKHNDLSETGDSFGLGTSGKVSGKMKMGADLEQFKSVNQYLQTLAGGTLAAGTVPTPNITNKLFRLKMFAQYAVSKTSDLRFNLIYEKWTTDDWSWMFPGGNAFVYGTGGAPNDGTSVISDPRQDSVFLGVRYIYRFQ
jgi:MtrB/PioB family decaheme-associated outer membrane protein